MGIYILVALIWLIPDSRIARVFEEERKNENKNWTVAADYTNFAESGISTALSARDTGQLVLAEFASSRNFSRVIPGTFPVRERWIPVIFIFSGFLSLIFVL